MIDPKNVDSVIRLVKYANYSEIEASKIVAAAYGKSNEYADLLVDAYYEEIASQ